MPQWSRALAAPEDLGSVPSTFMVSHNCNSRSKGLDVLFWPL